MRSLKGVVLAVGLVLSGLLPGVAFAQAADGTGDSQQQPPAIDDVSPAVVDSVATGAPTLECTVIALPIMAPEMSGIRFVCRVAGAQPGDTTFIVRATRAAPDPQLAAPLRASTCTGSLAGGAGVCLGSLIDRASSTTGELSFVGTLQPSGATLGPVAVANATPQPQPRGLTAPPAPLNYFPLPEP